MHCLISNCASSLFYNIAINLVIAKSQSSTVHDYMSHRMKEVYAKTLLQSINDTIIQTI